MTEQAIPRETHRMPARLCPACGYHTDAASGIDGKATAAPGKGDITMCLACGAILQFDAFGTLKPSDPSALRAFAIEDPEAHRRLHQSQKFVRTQKDWAPRDRRGGRA